MGVKLAEGKGLREGWDSKELWKCVEGSKTSYSKRPSKASVVRVARGVPEC